VAKPREFAASKVFKKSDEDGPVGVMVFIVLLSNSEACEELNPIEAKARQAGGGRGRASLHVSVDVMSVK
jgi:hypothetical protein